MVGDAACVRRCIARGTRSRVTMLARCSPAFRRPHRRRRASSPSRSTRPAILGGTPETSDACCGSPRTAASSAASGSARRDVVTDVEADEMFSWSSAAGRPSSSRTGATLDVGPGDVGVLERGARTIWTVHETLRKAYQITSRCRRARYAGLGAARARSGSTGRRARARRPPLTGDATLRSGDRRRRVHRPVGRDPWPSRTIPRATSWCSRATPSAAGASGRNGGFVDASLTHGLPNGLARFPDEIELLERLGLENLAGLEETHGAVRHRGGL